MPLTARQKMVIGIAIMVLAGLGVAFNQFFLPTLKTYAYTNAEVDLLERELRQLREEYKNHDDPVKYLEKLKPAVAKWETAYNNRAKVFTKTLSKIPATEKMPEIHFNEEWKATRDRLLEKARRLNIGIPTDVGFGSGFPAPEEVETLLNQLANAEYVLDLAMESGVLQVNSFGVGAPIYKNGFVGVIPVQIGFLAPVEAVKKFLYWCGYGPQYIRVESVSLSVVRDALGGTNLQAQLLLTTTWILEDKKFAEEKAPETGFGPGGLLPRPEGAGTAAGSRFFEAIDRARREREGGDQDAGFAPSRGREERTGN